MYFPVGWPKRLATYPKDGSTLVYVATDRERHLFAVLTDSTIVLWYCKPTVQILLHRRSVDCVAAHGTNLIAEWKPDHDCLAITTSKGFILFYAIEKDIAVPNTNLYVQKEERRSGNKREIVHVGNNEYVPALKIHLATVLSVRGGIQCMVCLRDDLVVSTGDGRLLRVKWDGTVNSELTIHINIIPFSVDLAHSRVSQLGAQHVWVSDIEYSPLLGGFAVVLSNGRPAFITATTLKFEPSNVVGVWIQESIQATCSAINHKYTLMAFGCRSSTLAIEITTLQGLLCILDNYTLRLQVSGEGVIYALDETTGSMQVSHKLVVSSKDFPDALSVCGAVRELKWTPDGCALALAWERGGFSLWSVFGALLLCFAGPQSSLCEDVSSGPIQYIRSMEWGTEGYHLWLVSHPQASELEETAENGSECASMACRLLQLHFVKSALTVNPCTGEDKLYLNTEETVPSWASGGGQVSNGDLAMMSKQWQVVPLPHTYLAHNWPIRYAAVNSLGTCVAVAGRTGLAHYALFTRRWKLFGNETQERDMVVTGGLTWWKDFVCTACYNLLDQRDEVRFYPRDCKLDNTFANSVRIPSQIMLLNTFHNILIVLCADSHIMIFRMTRESDKTPSVTVSKVQEVAIGNFIPHPATVITITMTSLRTETAPTSAARGFQPAAQEAESIMLNVAGRLLMFQRDRSGPQVKATKDTKDRPLPFCAPVKVASNVESMWSCTHPNNKKPHLTEALWLGCGAAGMKVWLPLHHKDDGGKARGFMSKRIMLPFQVDIYTLAIMFEGGIILGATADTITYNSGSAADEGWPFMQLERTSQVYLHHILRQLLRRNLGVHALEMARSVTDLPYFAHVLELLLHEVLEEEATSKEPIPDPLLPRVVAFVQEFPEFLQTIVHCARKTEVALWQYLFTTVGNPKDLFEECLMSGDLQVAASYLIILQNMEKPIVSRQHATLLLDKSLESCSWDLARNLVRFLRAIGRQYPDEVDEGRHAGSRARNLSTPVYTVNYQNSPAPTMERDSDHGFVITAARNRTLSQTKDEPTKDKLRLSRCDSQTNSKKVAKEGTKEDGSVEQFFIDVILNRHARKLLTNYRLRDLACFAANLDDYQLVSWLRKERLRAARVEDFTGAIKKLHEDFKWPLPVLTLQHVQSLHRIASFGSLTSSHSAPSLLDSAPHDSAPLVTQNGQTKVSTPQTPETSTSSTPGSADVFLQPQISLDSLVAAEDSSVGLTEQSDTSSALGELDGFDTISWSDSLCLSELEQLSQELANKGPPQSDVELRYLLQMMLEAGCLEWSLLIAILLRDAMAVVRTVNTASMTDTPIEIVGRMREGMSFLDLWADTECFGYKPFLAAIQAQTQQLARIVEQNPPTSRLSIVTKRLSSSSVESTTDTERTLVDVVDTETESLEPSELLHEHAAAIKEEEQDGCAVS